MKSFFAPSLRLLAGGLMLATATADSECAAAKTRHSRSGDALIEELGAPSGKGFDDIVVKLAPLVPARPAKDAAAERPPALVAAPEAPTASAAAPPPSDSAKPAPAAPVFLREPLPVIDSAPADEIAKSAEPNIVTEPSAPAAVAPQGAEAAGVPVETMAQAPVEAKPDAPVDRPDAPVELSREAAAPSEPTQTAEPEKSEPPVVAETEPAPAALSRPPGEEQPAQEESESPLALWQALVAALALVGLLAMKYVRRTPAPSKAAASKPAPAKAEDGEGDAARSGQKGPTGRFAAIRASIGVARAKIEAVHAEIAALRGGRKAAEQPPAPSAAAPKEAPKKPKASYWTEVATALRQRFGGAKPPAVATAHERSRVIALVETESKGRTTEAWEASEEDGPELLEPGDASARAIVMNARRRLRSAQS